MIQSGKTSKVPDQNPKAVAPIVKFNSQPGRVVAVADLSTAYGGMARQARRGIALVDRKRVLVQDEVETAMPSDVWWFMTAPAASTGRSSRRTAEAAHMSMELGKDSSEAMLSKDKARLWVHIVAPRGAKFEILGAKPLPTSPNPSEQNANAGIRKLAIHLPGVTRLGLTVEMVPLTEGENPPDRAGKVTPLAEW